MKIVKVIFLFCFTVMLVLPVICMNTEKDTISEIDNTMLPELNYEEEIKPIHIDGYLSKRIGFYDDAITSYIELNDSLFGEMVHPTYTYGEDGYVFLSWVTIRLMWSL